MSMHYGLRKSINADELFDGVSKRSASARRLGLKARRIDIRRI
jgi:hypothetical protein